MLRPHIDHQVKGVCLLGWLLLYLHGSISVLIVFLFFEIGRNLIPYLPNGWLRTVNHALTRAYVLMVRGVIQTLMMVGIVVSEYGSIGSRHVVERVQQYHRGVAANVDD